MHLASVLSTLLIVAGAAGAPTDSGYPEATDIFRCIFDEQSDTDFDGWPDGWTRRQGPGFPHYVKIEISDDPKDRTPAPREHRPLRIDLDGGGAVAYTAPIPIRSLFNFVAEGYVQTRGLKHDRAYLSLTLLNRSQQPIETFLSEKIGGSQPWKRLRLGPVSPSTDEARFAVLGLHLQPLGADSDLRGTALFGDLWIGRLPRMVISIQGDRQVLREVKSVGVTCRVSGITGQDAQIHFELLDALGNVIEPTANVRMTFESADAPIDAAAATGASGTPLPIPVKIDEKIDEKKAPPAASSSTKEGDPSKESEPKPPSLIGAATWKPSIPGPGFYRISVSFPGKQGSSYFRQMTLAVISPQRSPSSGEFGWSLPHAEVPLGFPAMAQLLSDAGINWVKCPLWFARDISERRVEDIVGFNERLAMQGIEVVGVLCYPPDEVLRHFEALKPLKAADLFSVQANVWFPSLETVMSRLGTQVRWWQLGADKDNSFVGYSELLPKVLQVRSELNRIGRDVNVGVGWSWRSPWPELPAGQTALRFFSLSATPPLEPEELADFLSGRVTAPPANGQAPMQNTPIARRRNGNGNNSNPAGDPGVPPRLPTSATAGAERPVRKLPEVRRFVLLEPLSRQGHAVGDRAKNLVQQMLAAKTEGAEGIFISDPFHTETGLMNGDGSPGELFLPWRTTAMALAGSESLGSLYLPQGSANHVFTRANDAVMVVWNPKPSTEQIYLGGQARQIDLWGRDLEIASDEIGQTFKTGPLPTFLTGLHKSIALWQVGFTLDRKSIPSVFGARHPLKFEVLKPLRSTG